MDKITIKTSHLLNTTVACKDEMRGSMNGVFFNCDTVASTNGHALIVQNKIDDDSLKNKLVTVQKLIAKDKKLDEITFSKISQSSYKAESYYVSENGSKIVIKDCSSNHDDIDLTFPDLDVVTSSLHDKKLITTIGIDSKLLLELAKGLNNSTSNKQEVVKLEIFDGGMFKVVGSDKTKTGYIMEVRIKD